MTDSDEEEEEIAVDICLRLEIMTICKVHKIPFVFLSFFSSSFHLKENDFLHCEIL